MATVQVSRLHIFQDGRQNDHCFPLLLITSTVQTHRENSLRALPVFQEEEGELVH